MKRKKTFLTTIQNASVIKEMAAKILQGVQGGQMTSRWAWHSMAEALGKVSQVTSLRIEEQPWFRPAQNDAERCHRWRWQGAALYLVV